MSKTKIRDRWIWRRDESSFYESKTTGLTLHVCCGKSKVGDVRTDLYESSDVKSDYRHLPFRDLSFETVICDPPWAKREALNKGLSWLFELRRVAKVKIIIIHHCIFKIPMMRLVETWAINARGILWKCCAIYTRITKPLSEYL